MPYVQLLRLIFVHFDTHKEILGDAFIFWSATSAPSTLALSDTFSDRLHEATDPGCLRFRSKTEVHNEIQHSDMFYNHLVSYML